MLIYLQSGSPPEGVMSKVIDLQKRTASLAFEDLKKKIVMLLINVNETMNSIEKRIFISL